eukprot:CAMPEP_0172019842 /NCGR_PEP_ID=MMETSP1041-20130122/12872_1 /TAXON_ID=464988 /ORGANISM="Hemiselmis andersenii, Strain CCMP439" /LENGTH=88 /DNA_ID=CAMNT_0012675083 /DNA_START=428 /DNA_END=691 /DNA_ORIENTATION=-
MVLAATSDEVAALGASFNTPSMPSIVPYARHMYLVWLKTAPNALASARFSADTSGDEAMNAAANCPVRMTLSDPHSVFRVSTSCVSVC